MSDNPTYNGVPRHVLKEAIQKKSELAEALTYQKLMNLISEYTYEGYIALATWLAKNPKGVEQLLLAIERYIEGREDL